MYEELDKAIADLKDTKSGWVTRRDAALALGTIAGRAIAALSEHADEDDVDVRGAVEDALREVNPPEAPPKTEFSLAELVAACHRPPRREVSNDSDGEGFRIRLQINEERWQTVFAETAAGRDDEALVRVYTLCGEPTDAAMHWGLKTNGKLVHCALAVEKIHDKKQLILVNNLQQASATPEAVKQAVKEIALYGDWLEKKLSDQDEL